MMAAFQAVFWVEKTKTSDILRPSPQITQGHFCSILLVKTSHEIIPDSRVEKSDSISKRTDFLFLENFYNMSVGCQGQGKTCAAFRRLWKPWGPRAAPGSPPSLPRPPWRTWEKWEHKARARQVRREDNCEAAALGPTRQEACLPDRLHPRRAAHRKQLRSGDPRASLGTGDDATTGPRGPEGLPGALQEHRPGPLPRTALKQEVPAAIPAQPSERPSRETARGPRESLCCTEDQAPTALWGRGWDVRGLTWGCIPAFHTLQATYRQGGEATVSQREPEEQLRLPSSSIPSGVA